MFGMTDARIARLEAENRDLAAKLDAERARVAVLTGAMERLSAEHAAALRTIIALSMTQGGPLQLDTLRTPLLRVCRN